MTPAKLLPGTRVRATLTLKLTHRVHDAWYARQVVGDVETDPVILVRDDDAVTVERDGVA